MNWHIYTDDPTHAHQLCILAVTVFSESISWNYSQTIFLILFSRCFHMSNKRISEGKIKILEETTEN